MILKNKKGIEWFSMVMILAVILALGVGALSIAKSKEKATKDGEIDFERIAAMVNVLDKQVDEFQRQLNELAVIAAKESVAQITSDGVNKCGTPFGFNLWFTNEKPLDECTPNTQKAMNDLPAVFSNKFSNILTQSLGVPPLTFKVDLLKGSLTFIAEALNSVYMVCKDDGSCTYLPQSAQTLPVGSSLYTSSVAFGPSFVDCDYPEDKMFNLKYTIDDLGRDVRVFVPKEAMCGGNFPLLFLLHGHEKSKSSNSLYLGQGFSVEKVLRKYIDEGLSGPVVLVAPRSWHSSEKQDPWSKERFDPYRIVELVEKKLLELSKEKAEGLGKSIGVTSVSATGHSAANCYSGGLKRLVGFEGKEFYWLGMADGDCNSQYVSSVYKKPKLFFHMTDLISYAKNDAGARKFHSGGDRQSFNYLKEKTGLDLLKGKGYTSNSITGSFVKITGNVVSGCENTIVNGGSGEALISKWSSAIKDVPGKSWIGKLSSNGPNDDFYRVDKGRDVIVYAPCETDFNKPIEMVYYFHGIEGFDDGAKGFDDMNVRLAPQMKQMKDRNVVLVFPELPWSAGENKAKRQDRGRGDGNVEGHVWNGEDSDIVKLHNDVLNILNGNFGTVNLGSVSMTGHSAGGAALQYIGSGYDAIKPSRITFSDADYSWTEDKTPSAMIVYNDYVKNNPSVEFNMLAQDHNTKKNNLPTCNAIKTVGLITGSAGWNCVREGSETKSYTSPAKSDEVYTIPGTNINYYPLKKGHKAIGAMSLAWKKGEVSEVPTTSPSQTSSSVTLLFVGDTTTLDKNSDPLANVKTYFSQSVTFMNLETLITSQDYTAEMFSKAKAGTNYHLKINYDNAKKFLVNSGVDIVTVANNHAGDFGVEGLTNTINFLKENSIPYCGVGLSLDEARAPVIIEVGGFKIGYVCYTEYVNSPYGSVVSGMVNKIPSDRSARFKQDVARAKDLGADLIVFSFHWGDVDLLAENLQIEVSRIARESGADLVIGHGPHRVQGIEFNSDYQKPIVYSLGNFVSGRGTENPDQPKLKSSGEAAKAFMFSATFDKNSLLSYSAIPIQIKDGGIPFVGSDSIKQDVEDRSKYRNGSGDYPHKYLVSNDGGFVPSGSDVVKKTMVAPNLPSTIPGPYAHLYQEAYVNPLNNIFTFALPGDVLKCHGGKSGWGGWDCDTKKSDELRNKYNLPSTSNPHRISPGQILREVFLRGFFHLSNQGLYDGVAIKGLSTGMVGKATGSLTFGPLEGKCSYAGANLNVLKTYVESLDGYSDKEKVLKCIQDQKKKKVKPKLKRRCFGPCFPDSYVVSVPFIAQFNSKLNKITKIETSQIDSTKYKVVDDGVPTCWRGKEFQTVVNQLDVANPKRDYVAKLNEISGKSYSHARTLGNAGCGAISTFMLLQAFGSDATIMDVFCPNVGPFLSYMPGGSDSNSRHRALTEGAGLGATKVSASDAKTWSFEQYKKTLQEGKGIIVSVKEAGEKTAGENNQLCNGQHQTGGHNLVLSGISTYDGVNYFILNDPGCTTYGKYNVVTEEYFKNIIKNGLNVAWRQS